MKRSASGRRRRRRSSPCSASGSGSAGIPPNLPEPLRDVFVDDSASLSAEATEVIEDNYFRSVDRERARRTPRSTAWSGRLRAPLRGSLLATTSTPRTWSASRSRSAAASPGSASASARSSAGLRVGRVFPGAPAEEAGIAVGDVIVSVNERSIAGEDSEVATAKIKGPTGTEVTIGVRRPPERQDPLA